MSEHLVYRAQDWATISSDLPPTRPFTHHLRNKAKAATDRFGPDYPFAETVHPDTAVDIKKIAHLKGIETASGGQEE